MLTASSSDTAVQLAIDHEGYIAAAKCHIWIFFHGKLCLDYFLSVFHINFAYLYLLFLFSPDFSSAGYRLDGLPESQFQILEFLSVAFE